jgi:AcrR family transcriptional regulator
MAYHRVMATGTPIDASRREAILDAALECFLLNSVAGTTIDDLRLRSGASVGSIYHHFGSKERLAAELYLETLREYQGAFIAALHTSRSARAGVEGAVHHHLRWVAARPDRASYLFHCREPEVNAASDEAAKALNAGFYTQAAEWLLAQVDRGRIRALRPELYHALWMGPSLEFARQWLAGARRRADLLAAEAPLAQAAWGALRAG